MNKIKKVKVTENFLPENCYKKGRKQKVDLIVIHYISAINVDEKDPFSPEKCIKILKDYKFSAHYLIARDGKITRMVSEVDTAWHAGKSNHRGRQYRNSCNEFSIGIELIGGKWIKFTEQQYTALTRLTKEIVVKYNLTQDDITGHEHIATSRKIDPGDHFDWDFYFKGVFDKEKKEIILGAGKFSEELFKNKIKKISENKIKKENNLSNGRNENIFTIFIDRYSVRLIKIFKNILKKLGKK